MSPSIPGGGFFYLFTLDLRKSRMQTVRAVEGAGPYNYEIGASENVGGGALDAPCSIFPFPHRLSANTEQYAVWEGQDPPLL